MDDLNMLVTIIIVFLIAIGLSLLWHKVIQPKLVG